MKELADGIWQLTGFPPDNVNIYVLGDVLIDAGMASTRAASSSRSRAATSRPTR